MIFVSFHCALQMVNHTNRTNCCNVLTMVFNSSTTSGLEVGIKSKMYHKVQSEDLI